MDEVEKAHPDVFNILLQVLEDGRLTDGQGRTVDFRNTVIVMTSNLGSDLIQTLGAKDEDYQEIKDSLLEVVARHFRPEFVNRIDEVVVFHPLTADQIKGIATFQLALLNKRLAEQELKVSLSDEALATLSEVGFDPVYGARPLKRAIQQRVENPLAQAILNGQFQRGDQIVGKVDQGKMNFVVER